MSKEERLRKRQQRRATPVNRPSPSTTEDLPEILSEQDQEQLLNLSSGAPSNAEGTDVNELAGEVGIIRVTNLDCAIFLCSVGVELRKDPPYTHLELTNGSNAWVFNFEPESSDGEAKTRDLIELWKNPERTLMEEPDSVVSGAISALKNRARFVSHMHNSKPWVCFASPKNKSTIMVIKDSKRYQRCVAKGMRQIDPFEKEKQHANRINNKVKQVKPTPK